MQCWIQTFHPGNDFCSVRKRRGGGGVKVQGKICTSKPLISTKQKIGNFRERVHFHTVGKKVSHTTSWIHHCVNSMLSIIYIFTLMYVCQALIYLKVCSYSLLSLEIKCFLSFSVTWSRFCLNLHVDLFAEQNAFFSNPCNSCDNPAVKNILRYLITYCQLKYHWQT